MCPGQRKQTRLKSADIFYCINIRLIRLYPSKQKGIPTAMRFLKLSLVLRRQKTSSMKYEVTLKKPIMRLHQGKYHIDLVINSIKKKQGLICKQNITIIFRADRTVFYKQKIFQEGENYIYT